jgi:hypothetical protein
MELLMKKLIRYYCKPADDGWLSIAGFLGRKLILISISHTT